MLICLLIIGGQQAFAGYTNQNFDNWTNLPSFGTYTNVDGWIMVNGKIRNTTLWPDPYSEPYSGWLADANNNTNSYLRSPLFTNGVGIITYYGCNKEESGENVFAIQYSTNATSWTTAAIVTNSSASWTCYTNVVDVFDSVYIRFLKVSDTGSSEQDLGLDDIVVYSAPGVSFSSLTIDPVSPVITNEVYICVNARTNPAVSNIVLTAKYRFGASGAAAYNSVSMVNVSSNMYRSSSPVPAGYEGTVYYYVQGTYSGLGSSPSLYPYGGSNSPASYESDWCNSSYSGNTNQNFDSWTNLTSWGTYVNSDGWIMFNGKIRNTSMWPDPYSEPYSGWLADANNNTNSCLRTPRFTNGVGTITYYCCNKENGENVFAIQYSIDAANWTTAVTETNSSTSWVCFTNVIDVFESVYVRFLKISDTGTSEQNLGLDDITVGRAPGVSFSNLTTDPVSPVITNEVYICVNARMNPAVSNVVLSAKYRLGASGGAAAYNSVSMVSLSNNMYRSLNPVPAGYEGTVYYYIQATYSGLGSSPSFYPYGGSSSPASYESVWCDSSYSGNRSQNFDSWTNRTSWGTYVNSDGWIMFNGKIRNTIMWPDPHSEKYSGWLADANNNTNSNLRTPRFTNGVGTITYYCCDRGAGENVFAVQYSADAESWITAATMTYSSNTWVCYTNFIDVFESVYVRFLKISDIGTSEQILGLDDIYVGSAPGVSFSNLTTDPVSPVATNEVYFCVNARTNPAASDIVLSANYRLGDSGSYSNISLVNVTNDLYRMSSPVATGYEGTVYYYVQATYSGLDSSSVFYPPGGSNNPASYTIGTDLPFVNVLSASTTVDNSMTSMVIGGTNNPNVVGTMRWTNSLTLNGGTFEAEISWLIVSVDLGVGTNLITVYGTNTFGVEASDSVTIIRSSLGTRDLTVISEQGGASPGTLTTNYNTTLNQFVTNSPVVTGSGTQLVCTGAAVIGNDYTQVNSTNVALTLTNDATLTWSWQTQYLLTVQTNGSGSVSAYGGWFASGGSTALTATASAGWFFTGWSDGTNGCGMAGNVITASMTQARVITANFTRNNHTPQISTLTNMSILFGTTLDLTVSATDSDGTIPSLSAAIKPDAAIFTDNGNGCGTFTWTPTQVSDIGSTVVRFVASDGELSATNNITINVPFFLVTSPTNNTVIKGVDMLTVKWVGVVALGAANVDLWKGTNLIANLTNGLPALTSNMTWQAELPVGLMPGSNYYVRVTDPDLGNASNYADSAFFTISRNCAADFDGDGKSDYGCYDAAGIPGVVQPGQWYFKKSTEGFDASVRFGYAGTVPVVGDFDGDGKSDFGCYDAAGVPGVVQPGQWYFMKSAEGFDSSVRFGYAGTVPVVGDFDGDGIDDFGCYDAVGVPGVVQPGQWYFMKSAEGFDASVRFGYAGTVPVVGDFDGDGIDDFGCYDAAGVPGVVQPGQWYFMKSTEGFDASVNFGYAGTVPVVGDYDGDGIDDFGCYDAAGVPGAVAPGAWYFMKSTEGFSTETFGYAGTVPLGGLSVE